MTAISALLRTDLASVMPIERVFQKHVIDGPSFLFRQHLNEADWEYELRDELATALRVSINDVVIVGSAKLGFSLKTENFLNFDHRYSETRNPRDKSDVDVAVINRERFDEIAKQIYSLSRHFNKEWIGENWKINAFHKSPINLSAKYTQALAKGWLRPDYLPLIFYETAPWRAVCDAWFRKLKRRKVTVGIYSEWFYLKHYQLDNLSKLRVRVSTMEI